MNISMNTLNLSSQYNNNIKNRKNENSNKYQNNSIAFRGANPANYMPKESKFLSPVGNAFDRFTTWINKNYTSKLYASKFSAWMAKHTDKLESVVDHMQVAGSVIISGMYMGLTLTNENLDDDRKKTLAINQGLTFAASTLGSYLIDNSLDEWWERSTQKYAAKQLGDDKLPEKIAKMNEKIIQKAEKDFGKSWDNINKKERPKLTTALSYVEKEFPNTIIEKRIKGRGILKKLLVFGTVYRFISPVLVAPIANSMGKHLISAQNKAKEQKDETKKA